MTESSAEGATPRVRPLATVKAALAIGLLAGLSETVVRGYRRLVLHELNFVPDFNWWLAPLVTAAIVALLTVVVVSAIPARWSRSRTTAGGAVPLTLLMVAVLAILFGEKIHSIGTWLLSVGFGLQTTRWAAHRFPAWLDRIGRTIPILLAPPAILLLGAGVQGLRTPAALASPPASAPNVLLIVLDAVRASDLGIYGGSSAGTSATLGGLAREGVSFSQAYSTSSWSGPSHGSILTGRWAHELSIDWTKRLDRTYPTLAEVLAANGYVTAGFTGNAGYVSRETGLARGVGHYEDYRFRLSGLSRVGALGRYLSQLIADRVKAFRPSPTADRIWGTDIVDRLLGWLDRRGGTAPFYVFLNLFDAHWPYYPSDSSWRKYVGAERRRPLTVGPTEWKPDAVDLRHRGYVGAIADQDALLGRLLAALKARGLYDQTIVVVTSDHGEEFLEHGVMGHGQSLYLPALEVPLVIRTPAGLMPSGRTVSMPVSNRQIGATLIDLIGIADSSIPGPSLVPAWRDSTEAGPGPLYFKVSFAENLPDRYPVSHGPLRSVLFRSHHYIIDGNRKEHLFDLRTDRAELVDLIDSSAAAALAAELRDSVNRTIPR